MPTLFFGGKKVELPACVFPSNIKKWILEKWNVWKKGTGVLFPLFFVCCQDMQLSKMGYRKCSFRKGGIAPAPQYYSLIL